MKRLLLLLGISLSFICTYAYDGVVLEKSILLMKSGDADTIRILEGSATAWACDNEEIATVSDGIVKAIANGTATITITSADGTKTACTINVSEQGANARANMPGMGGMPQMGQGGGQMPQMGQGGGQRPDGMQGGRGQRPDMGQGGQGGGQRPPQMGQGGQSGNRPGGGPGNRQGGGPGGPGGDGNDDSDATDPNAYINTEGDVTFEDKTFTSSTADANAVKVSGGTVTLTNCDLIKDDGASSNADGSSFYGTNSGLLARKGGKAVMNGGTITTNAEGANGIVAYGGSIEVNDVVINCSERLSRGVHVTGGGSLTAHNLTINTKGPNSSVIALDRGGGTLNVIGGTYNCEGRDCAVCYSTGELTVNGITGSSMLGEMGVIEGDNIIAINNSDLTSHADKSSRGLMILQSGSGDAGEGLNGIITVAGGSLTMTDPETTLIEIVTNVTGKVTLDGVKVDVPSGILMTVDYNRRWQTKGATGVLILSGEGTIYDGSIVADKYSKAEVTVNKGVEWRGAFDNAKTAKSTTLTVNGGTWTLTADSYVDNVNVINGGKIDTNGYKLNGK